MTNPYWQRQHQRYMTGGGVAARYPTWKERQAMDREQQAETDRAIEGLEKKRAASKAMLTALKEIRAGWSRHMEGDEESRQIALLDNAIAQAEAAGITTGEDLPK